MKAEDCQIHPQRRVEHLPSQRRVDCSPCGCAASKE
jgi:hypothetical protein